MAPPNTERAQRAWEAGIVLALLIFVPTFVLMCGYSAVSQERAYHAFVAHLNGLSNAFVLELNGSKVDDSGQILANLKRVKQNRFDHAPGRNPKWYRIEIRDQDRILRLLLARPGNPEDNYWVFLPAPESSRPTAEAPEGMRVGAFVDPQLAAFLSEYDRR